MFTDMTYNVDSGDMIHGNEMETVVVSAVQRPLDTLVDPSAYSTPNKLLPNVSWGESPKCVLEGSTVWIEKEESTSSLLREYEYLEDQAESASSLLREYKDLGDDHILRVQVASSLQKTTFYVPIATMLKREIEMRESAAMSQMSAEKWSSSTLYTLWKNSPRRRLGGEISLCLTPEAAVTDYCDVQWRPWMTSCIREFYHLGTIRVPDDCLGPDILMALEFFGIMTSRPEAFTFETPQALGRMKTWNAYFTHRHAMAEWVVSEHRISPRSNLVWATTPNAEDGDASGTLLHVNGGLAAAFGREAAHGATSSKDYLPSCQLIHFLFFDNESTNSVSKEMPVRMRRDFCSYVGRALDRVDVSFDLERVKITKLPDDDTMAVLRAVLRVEPQHCSGIEMTTPERHAQTRMIVNTEASGSRKPAPLATLESAGNGNSFLSKGSVGSEEAELKWFMAPYTTHQHDGAEEGTTFPFTTTIHKEGRYPDENSSPLEAGRISPEFHYAERIDTNFGRQPQPMNSVISDHIHQSMPVSFIDTDFGDLQSVMSALSYPKIDDSTVNSESSEFLFRQARKLGISKIPDPIKRDAPQPTVEESTLEGDEGSFKALPVRNHMPHRPPNDTGTRLEEPSDNGKTIQEKAEDQEFVLLDENPGFLNFLQGFLEGLCPAISAEDPTSEIQELPEANEAKKDTVEGMELRLPDPTDRRMGSRTPARSMGQGPVEANLLDAECSSGDPISFSGATKSMSHIISNCGCEESGEDPLQLDHVQDRARGNESDKMGGQSKGREKPVDHRVFSRTMRRGSAQMEPEPPSSHAADPGQQNRPVAALHGQIPDSYDIGRKSVPQHRPTSTVRVPGLPPREPRHRVRAKEQQKMNIARKKNSGNGLARQQQGAFPTLKTKPA